MSRKRKVLNLWNKYRDNYAYFDIKIFKYILGLSNDLL